MHSGKHMLFSHKLGSCLLFWGPLQVLRPKVLTSPILPHHRLQASLLF
uniref:Uncharacterized protein n=1 Tax=Arundo donax TaxID=35708 RepID=A0A0A9H6G6_ARUDO